jgi:DNA invertase Pin-like site-specific DNA recombinase
VVKGNYLPSEYKHDSFELRFTPLLNVEATGERVPSSMLKERDVEREEAEAERLALVQSLRAEGKSYREIAERTEMSAATVCRILQKVS